jgi:hypothetical protein
VSGRKEKEKEKEIPASSINEKKEIPPVAVPSSNKQQKQINLTLYEFGSRQTVLTIATK